MADNVQLPGTGQTIATKDDGSGKEFQEIILTSPEYRPIFPASNDKLEEVRIDSVTSEEELDASDLLLMAMDKNTATPLQVQLKQDLKQEPDGGLYIADMKGPYIWTQTVAAQPITIDCTGFQSVLIHKITTGVVTPYTSNDNSTFSATLAISVATSIPAATILTAAGMYIVPVTGKYIKLVGPASLVQCFIYLSQAPCFPELNATFNLAQIYGTNAVASSLAGTLVVGGPVATAVAPTTFPLPTGGVDASAVPLTRRTLTDQLGRTQIGTHPQQRASGVNRIGYDPAYINTLDVQDMSKEDGNSQFDILTQILGELQAMNQILMEQGRNFQLGQTYYDNTNLIDNTKFNSVN